MNDPHLLCFDVQTTRQSGIKELRVQRVLCWKYLLHNWNQLVPHRTKKKNKKPLKIIHLKTKNEIMKKWICMWVEIQSLLMDVTCSKNRKKKIEIWFLHPYCTLLHCGIKKGFDIRRPQSSKNISYILLAFVFPKNTIHATTTKWEVHVKIIILINTSKILSKEHFIMPSIFLSSLI